MKCGEEPGLEMNLPGGEDLKALDQGPEKPVMPVDRQKDQQPKR